MIDYSERLHHGPQPAHPCTARWWAYWTRSGERRGPMELLPCLRSARPRHRMQLIRAPTPITTSGSPTASTRLNSRRSSSEYVKVSLTERRLLCLLSTSLLLPILLFILSFSCHPSSPSPYYFSFRRNPEISDPSLPSVAYFISGADGDGDRILRLFYAVYHPKNRYLLHLDLSASQYQRDRLAVIVQSVPVFHTAGNVDVVGKADAVNPRGSSVVSSTLHGAAIMLRYAQGWDWFINLSASDYPLVTQDDLLHLLSFLPRDLNFIQHSSHIGWIEYQKVKPIVVDPSLYLLSRSDVFYATQRRDIPNAYTFFSGSASVILSRKFVEFCIMGLDNLPGTLLMYYANVPSSHECYFHTVACNSRRFKKTITNENLFYAAWDSPSKSFPPFLNLSDLENMTQSGAAFAQSFVHNDANLDNIDMELLNRKSSKVVPGGWCIGKGSNPCIEWGGADVLRPGAGAKRLEKLLLRKLSNRTFHSLQCVSE